MCEVNLIENMDVSRPCVLCLFSSMRALLSNFLVSLTVPVVIAATNVTTPPNVILLMADDQGWADVGYNRPGPVLLGVR